MNTLLFDLDDTLYDLDMHRFRHIDNAWQDWLITLPPMAVPYILQDVVNTRIFFNDMPEFLGRYGVTKPMIAHLCAYSQATWFRDLRLDEGVAPLLRHLSHAL
jgi:FMN phosphatase YigB (HAD superfamily)